MKESASATAESGIYLATFPDGSVAMKRLIIIVAWNEDVGTLRVISSRFALGAP